jgi:hypothetical protein
MLNLGIQEDNNAVLFGPIQGVQTAYGMYAGAVGAPQQVKIGMLMICTIWN